MTSPKLFISYSWSSPEHEGRVLTLATELRESGIDVILDKWDLREGQDSHAFMESMVTDATVTKVLLVCDRTYAEKADQRQGGVGTEAQIISPELYRQKDQAKFVALVMERDPDGKPYVPAYYKSRIHIDFSNPGKESEAFEQLLRWLFDKPLHVKPALGTRPTFLDEPSDEPLLRTATRLRRAAAAVREGRQVDAFAREYFNVLTRDFENLRLSGDDVVSDDAFVQSLEAFVPYRNELIQFLDELVAHNAGTETTKHIHRFLENLLRYNHRPDGMQSWRETDFDNFRFLNHEVFLYVVAILLKHERFDDAAYFLDSEYYAPYESNSGREDMVPFTAFCDLPRMPEIRNERLQLRRLSLHADLLKQRCADLPIDFAQLMQSDFVLYLRAAQADYGRWYPVTLLYTARFAPRFEVFARSKSIRYFDMFKIVLGVQDADRFKELVDEFVRGDRHVPRWQYDSLDVKRLSGVDEVASHP